MIKNTLLKATEAGANEIKRFFNGQFSVSNKVGINNLVTEADHAAENAIFSVIRESFPNHFILSEETGEIIMDSEYKWIIDPIDGTVNFANGLPLCCVSIGVEFKGDLVMGAVYNPLMNEFFFAERGMGSTLNDRKISVSNKSDIGKSCLATGFPYTYLDNANGPLQVFEKFVRQGIAIRRLGSAAIDLCWVAAGRFDAYFEHKLESWDSAAGSLIVQEAGGKVTDYAGNPFSIYQSQMMASNGLIHEEVLSIVNGGAIMVR